MQLNWQSASEPYAVIPASHLSTRLAALEGYQSWLGSRKVEVLATYNGHGQAYPGDDVVDQVSHDIKDISYLWDNALGGYVYPLPSSCDTACQNGRHEHVWSQSEGPTMVADANFATRHGKPFSLGEWGVAWRLDGHGGNDNPSFIQHIDDTRLRSGKFPNAAAKDRELFGR